MWMWCVRVPLWSRLIKKAYHNVVANRGTPEVIVTLRLKNGSDLRSGRPQAGHFHEHINDRLRRKAGDGGAAKVLDPANESGP